MRPIYLDHHATTPCDDAVIDAMLPYLREHFGNTGSSHSFGWSALEATERAREQVAEAIGAEPEEVFFTGGATESNNLAVRGTGEKAGSGSVITQATEHKCTLAAMRHLGSRSGFACAILDVDSEGRVDPEDIRTALRPDTVLVSIMLGNNEVGTIQPIAEIAGICRNAGVLLHCDAAQAIGLVPLDVEALGIDMLSLSAHKFYGPKGVGALYVGPRAAGRVAPQLLGGGQERGLRSGTLATHQIVGLGAAIQLAVASRDDFARRVGQLRDNLWKTLTAEIDDLQLNGPVEGRLPNNLNFSVPRVDTRVLMRDLGPVACSSGSACNSSDVKPSHVLMAMGLGPERAHSALRLGLGRGTTSAELEVAAGLLVGAIRRCRA